MTHFDLKHINTSNNCGEEAISFPSTRDEDGRLIYTIITNITCWYDKGKLYIELCDITENVDFCICEYDCDEDGTIRQQTVLSQGSLTENNTALQLSVLVDPAKSYVVRIGRYQAAFNIISSAISS